VLVRIERRDLDARIERMLGRLRVDAPGARDLIAARPAQAGTSITVGPGRSSAAASSDATAAGSSTRTP
jgi:hypothetical protein